MPRSFSTNTELCHLNMAILHTEIIASDNWNVSNSSGEARLGPIRLLAPTVDQVSGYLVGGGHKQNIRLIKGGQPTRSSEAKLNIHRLLERLDDLLAHFLGVPKQHHRVVAIEELVFD